MSTRTSLAWILRMAWRDSRTSRRRLLLFTSSMILGVAALVAIGSFGQNLATAINDEAKSLVGADLVLKADAPFSEEAEALIDSLGGDQALRVSFASMVLFPETGATRLGRVTAVEGPFPFYGSIETTPPEAADQYRTGMNLIADEGLLLQFGAEVGDSVKVGTRQYQIVGSLNRVPGESAAGAILGPRVYIPLEGLDPELLGPGSRVDYDAMFRFEPGVDAEAMREALRPRLRALDLGSDTVEEVREDFGNALDNLYAFLNLVGFIALVLGGLGVASAIHVYVRRKVESIATLRCLGAKTRQAFMIYLVQAAVMGLVGALLGALAGILVQFVLPQIFADFLPVGVEISISWSAVLQGIVIGLGVALVFALLPLLRIRRISPLRALRASVETSETGGDLLRWVLFGLIAFTVTGFAVQQTDSWAIGFGFAGGIALVFALLYGTARLLMVLIRRFFPSAWPYVWRQGLANLYRPNNQTAVLVLALGLGTFLIMTLYLTQTTLLSQIGDLDSGGQDNLVLFDVQQDQVEGLKTITEEVGLPRVNPIPIVSMRLAYVNGRRVEDLREDTTYSGSRWPLFREYRSTYRDTLTYTETLVEGTFEGQISGEVPVIPISIEQDIAGDLNVGVGDRLTFNVQGVEMETEIASIRQVDWQRVSANFFVVFPSGVLEEAPQTFVMTTRTETVEERAILQSRAVQAYPNVLIIDLELILETADQVLGRVAFVIRFMALFSILTGLTVLIAAVIISRYQRIRESVLLRTLGASRRQILRIMIVEYLFLGCLATITGLLLSIVGAWALAEFVFDVPFQPPWLAILLAFVLVSLLTIVVGLANSRGLTTRPPLEVLRAEAT